jgi:energy-coupling factor transport system ATP-binding protein
MIHFENAGYTYPGAARPALQNVDLHISEGELVLVAGPSGAGKSTLLRCINGLVPHFYGGAWSGRALVAGRDTRDFEPRALADVVGFVFQDPEAQMVVDVVEDELVFGMENLGLDRRVMRRRVEEALDQLEIAQLRRRRLHTLSGGERQRVAIAAVLTMQPRVLVLDEPTSQLDPHAAEEVLTALQKLNADLGLTIVLSEHRLERVVQYVDRIVFCHGHSDEGASSVVVGTPQAILRTAPFAPPLVELARALDWQPLPLTIKQGRKCAAALHLPPATQTPPAPEEKGAAWWRRRSTPGTAQAPAALAVAKLDVTLGGRQILHQIELAVAPSEVVALMGRNGSGKTTLLRTVMGLLRPDRGRISVGGRDITDVAAEERGTMLGYVPQDPRALLFQPTVYDELAWSLAQDRRTDQIGDRAARIAHTLDRLGLAALARRHPRDISVGEQQRAALATALVREPRVLLLDEPTRGLDYLNKAALTAILRRMREEGRAILLVTHDVELVAACADRVVLLGDGEVVTEGPTRTLLHESLIFSSQIGKLFPHQEWLTAAEAIAALRGRSG